MHEKLRFVVIIDQVTTHTGSSDRLIPGVCVDTPIVFFLYMTHFTYDTVQA